MNVENIKEALITFGGVKRRFNETKVSNQVIVETIMHTIQEKLVLQLRQREKISAKDVVAVFNHIRSQELKHF